MDGAMQAQRDSDRIRREEREASLIDSAPAIKEGGFYVEIAEGGPYLARDGSVTEYWANRGVWPSRYDAEVALHESTHGNAKADS
jgi:hypothetical protein